MLPRGFRNSFPLLLVANTSSFRDFQEFRFFAPAYCFRFGNSSLLFLVGSPLFFTDPTNGLPLQAKLRFLFGAHMRICFGLSTQALEFNHSLPRRFRLITRRRLQDLPCLFVANRT